MTTSTTHPAIFPLLPTSWQVMSDVCNETGRKAVAAAVRLSPACVHKWCEPPEVSGALNPLDRIIGITRITGDTRLIEWLCAAAGGHFVRDSAKASPAGLNVATGRCGVVLVKTLEVLSVAAEDGVICQREAPVLRAHWQTAKGITEGVVRGAEAGAFR